MFAIIVFLLGLGWAAPERTYRRCSADWAARYREKFCAGPSQFLLNNLAGGLWVPERSGKRTVSATQLSGSRPTTRASSHLSAPERMAMLASRMTTPKAFLMPSIWPSTQRVTGEAASRGVGDGNQWHGGAEPEETEDECATAGAAFAGDQRQRRGEQRAGAGLQTGRARHQAGRRRLASRHRASPEALFHR